MDNITLDVSSSGSDTDEPDWSHLRKCLVDSLPMRQGLADRFVREVLKPSRRPIHLSWLKVVAEVWAGSVMGDVGYEWVPEAYVERALRNAGIRILKKKNSTTVFCSPCNPTPAVKSFFFWGGASPW